MSPSSKVDRKKQNTVKSALPFFNKTSGSHRSLKLSIRRIGELKTPLLPWRVQRPNYFYYGVVTLLAVISCCFALYATQQTNFSFRFYTSLHQKKPVNNQSNQSEPENLFRNWFCRCSPFNASLFPNENSKMSCSNKSSAVAQSVLCEIATQFTDLKKFCSIGNLDWSCKPKLIKITCDQLQESSLPCSKAFVIEQYDYHTQFHCLYSIAQSLQPQKQAHKVSRLHHQVWFYGPDTQLEFHVYLGLASHFRYFKPEAMFLWNSGNLPIGRWWQEVISSLNQDVPALSVAESLTVNSSRLVVNRTVYTSQAKVYSVVRKPPSAIYYNEISQVPHKSDLTRLESALLFGGFYADIDTLSLKPLDPLLQYPLTMGRERKNGVGNMMIFSQPMAPYLFLWHASYFDMNKDEWVAHSIDGNHKLATQCPELIHVEHSSLLTPNYDHRNNFYSENFTLPDSYMVHAYWRHVEHSAYHNPEGIVYSKTLLGRLYRAVYYGLSSTSG